MSPALAHASPDAGHYRSTLTGITPPMTGLTVTVTADGEQITLSNATGSVVEVPGYTGEPYLRFTATSVEENSNSVSAQLNGNSVIDQLPAPQPSAAQAAPAWHVVATGPSFTWHDHRIHWMSQIRPPKVAADPGRDQLVSTWQVPFTVAGSPVVATGELRWLGDAGGDPGWLSGVALAVTAAVVLGLLAARRRNRAAS